MASPQSTVAILNLLLLLLLTRRSLLLADSERTPDSKAWDEEIGKTRMPKYLRLRVSTMTPEIIDSFSVEIEEDTLISDSEAFCAAGPFVCDANLHLPNVTISPTFESSDFLTHRHFKKSDVLVDQQIHIPDLKNDVPFKAFLPQALAKKFPLDSHFLPVLLDMLNIPPESRLAQYMEEKMSKCEKQGSHEKQGILKRLEFWPKTKRTLCATSLEEMADFISQNLGGRLKVLQPTRFAFSEQNMTVRNIAVMGTPESQKSVVCTDTIFPFSLFDCRVEKSVESMEVTLESEDNHLYIAVMQCTKVSSNLLNGHDIIPNEREDEEEVCHWMTDNDLVFVKRDEAMEEAEEEEAEEERLGEK